MGRPPRLIQELCQKIEVDWIENAKSGERLPRELELAKQYQASRGTIRAALAELENKRFIFRKSAKGAFVAERWTLNRSRFVGGHVALVSFKTNTSYPMLDSFLLNASWGLQVTLGSFGLNQLLISQAIMPMQYKCEDLHTHISNESTRAVVLMGTQPDLICKRLHELDLPICALDWDATSLGIQSFCLANQEAGAALVKRLTRLGHRRIAMITEAPDRPIGDRDPAWQERRMGILDELKKTDDVQPIQIHIRERGTIFDSVKKQLKELLSKPAHLRPTALITPTSGSEKPIRQLASSLGIQIPEDLTVVSFSETNPDQKVTGIQFSGKLLGEAAGHYLGSVLQQKLKGSRKAKVVRIKGQYCAGETHSHAPIG